MATQGSDIPFTFLASLFREIASIVPRPAKNGNTRDKNNDSLPVQTFKRWVNALHQKFGTPRPGTTAAIFRLLFPEEDGQRKYDMKEPKLIDELAKCYGVDPRRFTQWSGVSGCLGDEVRAYLEQANSNDDCHVGPLSIIQVDDLLNELAALSAFSDASVRNKHPKLQRRKRSEVIRDLFRNMGPEDASFLTQIILKDLRPSLYPLKETHTTAALLHFNTRAVDMLTKFDAMRVWDPSSDMLKAFRVRSDFGYAGAIFDMLPDQRPMPQLTLNSIVDIPKSRKGQGCHHSLNFLRSSPRVWAETKYDGERAQIHVEIQPGGAKPKITIFSKSKRNSTDDRHAIHGIIQEACIRVKHSVILDAEMVAFDGERVDEFWRIRRLIENTAHGVRGRRNHTTRHAVNEDETQASLMSNDSENRQLGLVIFDILALDSDSLLSSPYETRRKILEDTIETHAGRAILSERFPIDMTASQPEAVLAKIFSEHIADHQEGLVLKAEGSKYNDYRLPWVKFKRDYIPGYGDTVDLVLVGASWEKERARELRVGPKTFTTFYFGALKKGVIRKPHLEILFTASYGLNRQQLEELNFLLTSSESVRYPLPKRYTMQNYTFNLFSGLPPPRLLLEEPLLVELFGAGFTKAPSALHYELRWPRMAKIYRRTERSWKDSIDLDALQKIAYEAVGRDPSEQEADDDVREIWKLPALGPGVKCPLKKRKVAEEWEEKLCAMEGVEKLAVVRVREGPSPKRRRVAVEEAGGEGPSEHVETTVVEKRKRVVDLDGIHAASSQEPKGAPFAVVTNLVPPKSTPKGQEASRSPPVSQQGQENNRNVAGLTTAPLQTQTHVEHQLPTPSTSPVREMPDDGVKLEETRDVFNNTIRNPLDEAYTCFVRGGSLPSGGRCGACSKLKKDLPRDRRIHSLESLLSACGWSECAQGSSWVQRGAIVVETHGGSELLKGVLEHLRGQEKRERKPLTVLGCGGEVHEFV